MTAKLTSSDLQIVTDVAVFRGLKRETVEHIVGPANALVLRSHESLYMQGDPATAFFIIIDGWLKLCRITASGDEAVINVVKKGDSFGEAVAFSGTGYPHTAEAVTDCRVARIPADHVAQCIRENPDIALAMIASISMHLHNLVQQLEQLKAHSGVQRVAEFLVSMAPLDSESCDIALPYDKVLIAARLGLKPESLSRAFAKLRCLGVNVNSSHVRVGNIAKLRKFASDDRAAIRGQLRYAP